MKSERR